MEPAQARGDVARTATGAIDIVELVRRAQLGSAAAFERLVLEHGPGLHRYVAAQLRDEADAADVFQETLAAAWRGLPGLRRPERFRPWLAGIATNKIADALRRRPPAADRDVETVGQDDPETLAAREAMASLEPRHREVLYLRYLLGLSEEEVAATLDVRVGTVKSRTSRARRALQEALQ
jgi:RNA polymerase sigma factor (sigma-70 family)